MISFQRTQKTGGHALPSTPSALGQEPPLVLCVLIEKLDPNNGTGSEESRSSRRGILGGQEVFSSPPEITLGPFAS